MRSYRCGEVIASLPLAGVPDVVMHDSNLQRLYVAIGDPGLVCSFDSERLSQLESVETEQGAHTAGWDPIDRCLYVFCPASSRAAVYEEQAWARTRVASSPRKAREPSRTASVPY